MEINTLKLSSWSFIKSVTLLQPQPSAPEISRRSHSVERPLTNYVTNFQRSLSKILFWWRKKYFDIFENTTQLSVPGKATQQRLTNNIANFRKLKLLSYHYYYIIMVDHGWCIDICCPSPQCAVGQFIVSCNNMGLRTYWAAKPQFWDVSCKSF